MLVYSAFSITEKRGGKNVTGNGNRSNFGNVQNYQLATPKSFNSQNTLFQTLVVLAC